MQSQGIGRGGTDREMEGRKRKSTFMEEGLRAGMGTLKGRGSWSCGARGRKSRQAGDGTGAYHLW